MTMTRKHNPFPALADKRLAIARRAADLPGIPKMGTTALNLEAGLYGFAANSGMGASGGQGTGIIVARDAHGRVFKVELTQVDGPE